MIKKPDTFIMLLFFSCPFALLSLWIGELATLVFWPNTDFVWDLCLYGPHYIGNAVFNLFVGITAGFDIKKRFYGPILPTVCLLPTLVIFVSYTSFIEWFCVATTLLVGIGAMVVSWTLTRKKAKQADQANTETAGQAS